MKHLLRQPIWKSAHEWINMNWRKFLPLKSVQISFCFTSTRSSSWTSSIGVVVFADRMLTELPALHWTFIHGFCQIVLFTAIKEKTSRSTRDMEMERSFEFVTHVRNGQWTLQPNSNAIRNKIFRKLCSSGVRRSPPTSRYLATKKLKTSRNNNVRFELCVLKTLIMEARD